MNIIYLHYIKAAWLYNMHSEQLSLRLEKHA